MQIYNCQADAETGFMTIALTIGQGYGADINAALNQEFGSQINGFNCPDHCKKVKTRTMEDNEVGPEILLEDPDFSDTNVSSIATSKKAAVAPGAQSCTAVDDHILGATWHVVIGAVYDDDTFVGRCVNVWADLKNKFGITFFGFRCSWDKPTRYTKIQFGMKKGKKKETNAVLTKYYVPDVNGFNCPNYRKRDVEVADSVGGPVEEDEAFLVESDDSVINGTSVATSEKTFVNPGEQTCTADTI
jgi:hypothetical protein